VAARSWPCWFIRVLVAQGENENLQGALEKNQKYMQYLEMTCETTGDEFGEPLELQHRYENQAECNLDLKDRQKTGLKDLNELQTELRKLQMERSTQTQVKNTKIAQMRKRLEESKQQVYNLTHQIEQEEFDRLERTHQMGQVRMALDNTFARCVDRTTLASKKGKMQGVKDAQVQLEFIGEFCCDLQAINEAFKKKRLEHQREAVSFFCSVKTCYQSITLARVCFVWRLIKACVHRPKRRNWMQSIMQIDSATAIIVVVA